MAAKTVRQIIAVVVVVAPADIRKNLFPRLAASTTTQSGRAVLAVREPTLARLADSHASAQIQRHARPHRHKRMAALAEDLEVGQLPVPEAQEALLVLEISRWRADTELAVMVVTQASVVAPVMVVVPRVVVVVVPERHTTLAQTEGMQARMVVVVVVQPAAVEETAAVRAVRAAS